MNKIIEYMRGNHSNALRVGNATSSIAPPNQSITCLVPMETSRILLKSIEVEANKQVGFRVEFFEDTSYVNSRYNSGNVVGEAYDVLDLPYVDKESQGMMYFRIHNLSDVEVSYHIEVRGVELR